ncbi:GPI ethanolamine phosphate transferase 3-like [Plakobranchus ocellatus]|uniref:GPI ethanolamine phosphate transferase 3, catalytic subunit n=1 Tax=Plakobranchus ocellatus TaxID=259542 RepID=A0AAV4DL08_9GAST|nr:GPI ethanolamine phosphate transferase 3-like [Plakobranchus ocellatus]
MYGLKLFGVLFLIFILTLTGTLVFLKGFLLSRTVVEKFSECNVNFAFKIDDHGQHGLEGCWMHSRYKRAIVIIIDALKYDFMTYNVSLEGKDNVPPYKNRLKILYELERSKPLNTLKFKFIADPPTTTLQRLKGLTTGSLPTFVDAGANFQSTEINEDNIIDHMVRQNKKINFFGDDTWMSLFPNRFHKHFGFPSFDVKDLHTVDNGIISHIYYELQELDWDVTIAHFLGVDHCGHRYGPNHESMKDKLLQMNDVIRNVTRLMQDDTILFVMGDHGMTRTGDHGGDSKDELEAGLFIYSPVQLTSHSQKKETSVSQTDFVPTLSLLLGLPIPFSNLGMVIPNLFSHCPWWDTNTNEVRRVYHRVKALRLNALQISKYLHTYQEIASDLPASTVRGLQDQIQRAENELKDLVPDIISGGNHDTVLRQFQNIENIYKTYAKTSKETCQGIWAKFDMKLVFTGIAIILEEQSACEDSFFNTPLSSVDKAFVNQRYAFSVICLTFMVYTVRQWLKFYGNLAGSDAGVITMRYALPVAAVCIGLFWALQAVPESALEAFTPWQQAVLAQIVYVVIGLALAIVFIRPLLIYNYPASMSPTSAILNQSDMTKVIPSLYNQLKVQLSSSPEDEKPPMVYGLGSVYCASQVALVSLVSLILVLLLGDGMAPSLTLAIIALYLCLELYSSVVTVNHCSEESSTIDDTTTDKATSPLFSGLIMLNLLSTTFFYGTGHQATIPSIRFESAYTGFYGNFNNMILPGFLIWLNTFAGPVLFILACPLLVTWPALKSFFSRWMMGAVQEYKGHDKWEGDFKLFNNGIQLRRNMFQVCCGLMVIASLKLFSAACAAALHRRHLMVWKIFAPRLVYEAAFFVTTSVCVLIAYLFVLRVDKALTKFVESLPAAKGEKRV